MLIIIENTWNVIKKKKNVKYPKENARYNKYLVERKNIYSGCISLVGLIKRRTALMEIWSCINILGLLIMISL